MREIILTHPWPCLIAFCVVWLSLVQLFRPTRNPIKQNTNEPS